MREGSGYDGAYAVDDERAEGAGRRYGTEKGRGIGKPRGTIGRERRKRRERDHIYDTERDRRGKDIT